MFQVYGDQFSTDDMTGTSMSQTAKFTYDRLLRAARVWLVATGNPAFSDLVMKVYSDNGGSPGALIATSTNTKQKTEIMTLGNGIFETHFNFNKINLKRGQFYHFVINCTGYVYSESSCLAWKKAFPDPIYTTGLTIDVKNIHTSPRSIYFYTGRP